MSPTPPSVTARELEMLRLVAQGYTLTSAASRLDPRVSYSAAQQRLWRLMAKLGAHSSPHAVYEACRRGLLDTQVAPDPQPLLPPLLQYLLRLALCEGMTCRQIARESGYTPRTVQNYISRACRMLGADNRAQAVRVAIYTGDLALAPAPSHTPADAPRHGTDEVLRWQTA